MNNSINIGLINILNPIIRIPNLSFYWNAYTQTGYNNGDLVSSINNFAPNGSGTFSGTGTTRPIWQTGQQNGLPALNFTGTQWLENTTNLLNSGNSDCYSIVLAQANLAALATGVFFSCGGNTGAASTLIHTYQTSNVANAGFNSSSSATITLPSQTVPIIFSMSYNASGSLITYRAVGTGVNLSSTFSVANNISASSGSVLGGFINKTLLSNCKIYEFAIARNRLNAEYIDTIITYLRRVYAL